MPARLAPLHLLTGKGGVGKTTVAAALALEAARVGRRPIVVELGHRASLARAMGSSRPIGHEPVELADGVFATNVELDHALSDYLARRIRSRALARRVAGDAALRRFFDAAPAVPELLTLERIEALLARFDPVIVDLDATGHALMFLELPRVLASIAPKGPIGGLVRDLGALLADPVRTRLHLVTLPAKLPIDETLELHARLSTAGHAPLGALVVNRVPERPLPFGSDAVAAALLARLEASGAPTARDRDDLSLSLSASAAHDETMRALARLERTGLPRIELPDLGDEPQLAALAALGHRLAEVLV
jgi:hypothetical protein